MPTARLNARSAVILSALTAPEGPLPASHPNAAVMIRTMQGTIPLVDTLMLMGARVQPSMLDPPCSAGGSAVSVEKRTTPIFARRSAFVGIRNATTIATSILIERDDWKRVAEVVWSRSGRTVTRMA